MWLALGMAAFFMHLAAQRGFDFGLASLALATLWALQPFDLGGGVPGA